MELLVAFAVGGLITVWLCLREARNAPRPPVNLPVPPRKEYLQ